MDDLAAVTPSGGEAVRRPPGLARNTALNFADTLISLASALVVTVVVARLLGPAEYGLYSLVVTIVWFTYAIARLGINQTVRRYVAELDGRGQREMAATVAGLGLRNALISVGVASLLLAAAAGPAAMFFHQPTLQTYLLVGAATLVPMMVGGVLRNVLNGVQQYQYFVRMNLVTSPLWVVACTLTVWLGGGILGLLVASIAVELLNLAALGVWTVREVGTLRWRGRLPKDLRSRLARYNRAVAVLLVLNTVVWERSELLFLGRFHGADQVAYYAVPFSLTQRLTDLIPGALLGVLLPGLTFLQSAADPEHFTAMFSNSLRWLAILALPACLFGIPLAAAALNLLYGAAYSGAVPVLRILLLATPFAVLGQASSSALLGMEAQSWVLKTGIATALLSLVLDLFLIPSWGAVGAALANAATQATWAFAVFLPLWKRVMRQARVDILKTALAAAPLSLLLVELMLLKPPLAALVAAGVMALGLYAVALLWMRVVSAGELISAVRSHG